MIKKRFKYFFLNKTIKLRYQSLNLSKKLVVVFFHGFMSDITGQKPIKIKKFCKSKKIGFFTFEYSGHGKSSGKFINGNISRWTNDAKQLIKKKVGKKKKLILIGSSMGSWIALNLFPFFKKQIVGFIGIASAPEFLEKLIWNKLNKKIKRILMKKKIYNVENGGYTYPITKQLIINGRKNKIFKNKINIGLPIVLFHGLKDEVVPLLFSKKILKMCDKSKSKLIKIKNGDHSLSRKSDLKKICSALNFMIFNHL